MQNKVRRAVLAMMASLVLLAMTACGYKGEVRSDQNSIWWEGTHATSESSATFGLAAGDPLYLQYDVSEGSLDIEVSLNGSTAYSWADVSGSFADVVYVGKDGSWQVRLSTHEATGSAKVSVDGKGMKAKRDAQPSSSATPGVNTTEGAQDVTEGDDGGDAAAVPQEETSEPATPVDGTQEPVQETVMADDLPSLSEDAGFEADFPSSIDGYGEASMLNSVPGERAEAFYGNESHWVLMRKGHGNDLAGDYNEYANVKTADAGGVSVTLSGYDDGYQLATWSRGGFEYSINVGEPLSEGDMLALVALV